MPNTEGGRTKVSNENENENDDDDSMSFTWPVVENVENIVFNTQMTYTTYPRKASKNIGITLRNHVLILSVNLSDSRIATTYHHRNKSWL